MIKYNQSFKIPYYEADKHSSLSPISLLQYLGEVSMIHNGLLVDFEEMAKLNFGWMLNRWKVKMDKYPNAGEKLRIETWISEVDKFYAYREFIIYDEKNVELGKATAIWIFLDMKRKRPIRIKEEHYSLENVFDKKIFNEFHRFDANIEVDNNIDFHIRKSDIDYNDHVNNTKYLEWIIETIPDDVYKNYILSEFEILYKKEVKYPNTILTGIKEINNQDEERSYVHKIVDKNSKEEKTLGLSIWKKK